MKIIIYPLFLFIYLSCTTPALSQWQTIATSTGIKTGIVFLDAQNGIGIGTSDIFRTSDGGNTWTNISQQMGTTWGGDDIAFANAANGIIVKDNAFSISATDYYFTTDSGHTWQNPWTTFNNFVDQIQFTSSSIGYVLSTGSINPGEIYKSIDGGSTWNTLSTPTINTRFLDFEFINDSTGMIAAMVQDSIPTVFLTNNGGLSWNDFTVNLNLHPPFYIDMVSDTTGFLISTISGILYKSTDGFNTWNPVYNNSSLWIRAVQFPSVDTGYFSAYDTTLALDVIYQTIDGGITWSQQTFGGFAVTDMFFLNAGTGWLCGNNGNIAAMGISTSIKSPPAKGHELTIFPNPTNGNLFVTFNNPQQKDFSVHIYDSYGKLIQSIESIKDSKIYFENYNLSSGFYFIHVFTKDRKDYYTGKFLVD